MKKLLLFIFVLLLRLPAFAQALPDTNKVEAWYPICYDTVDHRLHGFDLVGSSNYTFDRFLNANSALDFDGLTQGRSYTTYFVTGLTTDFTYACWIYPRSNQNSVIIFNGDPNLNGFGLVMSDGAGGAGNQVGISFGGIGVFINAPVTLLNWHHLAFTRSGNAYRLFIDGVLAGVTVQPAFNPLSNRFIVGFDNTSGLNRYNGKIDDIIYYKSRILSVPQIDSVANFNPVAANFRINLTDTTVLCKDSIKLKTIPAINSVIYHYTWKSDTTAIPGTPISFNDSIYAPMPSIVGDSDKYFLSMSKTLGCTSIDTHVVKRAVYQIKLGFDTAFCIGDTLTLHAQGGDTTKYAWISVTAVGVDSLIKGIGVDSTWIDTTGRYVVVADSNACVATDTINIITARHPKVNLGRDTSSCMGEPVMLIDTVTHGSPTYVWSTGTSFNDTCVVTSSAMVWVRVTDSGCASFDTVNVFIAYDTFTLHKTDTAICRGATMTDVVVTGAFGLTYSWTPTAGIPPGFQYSATPQITPDTSAYYVVTASVGTCHRSDSFYVDVQPYPLVYLGGTRHVCELDSIRIAPTVIPAWYRSYIYDWSPGTNLDDSTAATVRFTGGDTTKLFLEVASANGKCTGKDSMMVYTHLANFVYLQTTVNACPGDTIRFYPVQDSTKYAEGPISYAWYYGPDFVNATDSTPLLNVGTSADYIGVATSKWGCQDTMNVSVKVQPAAIFYLEDSVVIFPGQSYHISPNTNAVTFHWSPGVGMSDTTASNPTVTPPVNTMYIVTAETAKGCSITDSIKVRVDAGTLVAVPNAFAPSGVNSSLYVIKRGAVGLNYFRIYDKWGNMVYESNDITAGWDGNYKGTPQPFGVYVYEVEAVTDAGKVFRQQGNVTLLR
jgi:gliding motility-associated-like protein